MSVSFKSQIGDFGFVPIGQTFFFQDILKQKVSKKNFKFKLNFEETNNLFHLKSSGFNWQLMNYAVSKNTFQSRLSLSLFRKLKMNKKIILSKEKCEGKKPANQSPLSSFRRGLLRPPEWRGPSGATSGSCRLQLPVGWIYLVLFSIDPRIDKLYTKMMPRESCFV